MTGITLTTKKNLLLFAGRAHPELAAEIAACLGIEPTPTKLSDFANGEIYVRFLESVRGCDAFVLQSHTAPINHWIMEQLIMVDALKRASAKRITVVTPFFGYARQDKKNRGREPISARLMADLFATAGADRLMAVDLHTAQIQGFFDGPVDHLFALPILAEYLERKLDVRQVTVVAPDAGRVRVCRAVDRPARLRPLAIIHKRRDPDVAQPGDHVRGRRAGGGAHLHPGGRHDRHRRHHHQGGGGAVRAGRADGDRHRHARRAVRPRRGHAEELARSARSIVTDTLPIPHEKRFDKLTVLSIAPLIARAINEVFSDGSVTSLFDGQHLTRSSASTCALARG